MRPADFMTPGLAVWIVEDEDRLALAEPELGLALDRGQLVGGAAR
jgi:hypothetical protein